MMQIRLYWKIVFYVFIASSSLHADWTASPTTLDAVSPNASAPATFVVDSSGNVMAAWLENVNGHSVIEASYYSIDTQSWTVPTVLDTILAAASIPQLLIDNSGIVTALWFEYLSGIYLVQVARFSNGSWTPPTTLNSVSGLGAYFPFLPFMIVDPFGDVTVAWTEQFPSSTYGVQAARYSGGSWSTSPTTLDGISPNASNSVLSNMIVDTSGNVLVIWVENLGSTYAIEAARFSAGAWESATILDNGTQSPNANTNVFNSLNTIIDQYGNATVSWMENINSLGLLGVQVNQFNLGSPIPSPSNPITLNTILPGAASGATLVVDNSGNVTASWLEFTNPGLYIEAAYYSIGTQSWSAATTLNSNYTPPVVVASTPQLVVDTLGNVTALWIQVLDDGNYAIDVARFSNGSWSDPITLDNQSDSQTDASINPLIVIDNSNNITAVWFEQFMPSNAVSVQASRYSNGSWTTPPVTLDEQTLNASDAVFPQLIVDPQGNVTVLWIENLGSSYAVESARFSGGAWGAATILDNGTQTPNASIVANTSLRLVADQNGNVTAGWLENSTNPLAVQVARFTMSATLFPPTGFRGIQKVEKALSQQEYVNVLSWKVPTSGTPPLSYYIYRDSSMTDLVAIIPSKPGQQQFTFFDHNRQREVQYTYYIYSIDAQGNHSPFAAVVVN